MFSQRVFIVFAATAMPAMAVADGPARPPQVWAILAGAPVKGDPAGLAGCARNPREVRNRLVEKLGWDGDHILFLDDVSTREHPKKPETKVVSLLASLENLDWAAKEWLSYRVRPGDLVLVYYAGRAVVAEDNTGAHAVLQTTDAAANPTWKLDSALEALASRLENPIVVLLDAPHPEAFDRDSERIDKVRLRQSDRLLGILSRWPGVSAWLSGRPRNSGPTSAGNPFLDALTAGLGSSDQPRNLLGCLDALNRDPRLIESRFQVSGGVGLDWTLWPKMLATIDRPPGVLLLHGHADRVSAIVTTSDGEKFITASMDSTIKIWRTRDQSLLNTIAPHTVGVTAMAISSDGSKLASGDGNGLVLLTGLDHMTPRNFSGARQHKARIDSIEFLPNSSRFVSLDSNGQAVLWDATGAEPKPKPLAAGAGAIASAEDWIAVAIRGDKPLGSILIYRGDGTPARELEGSPGLIRSGSLSLRGNRLAFGDDLGNCALLDLVTGERLNRWDLKAPIGDVKVWDDGRVAFVVDKILQVVAPSGPPVPLILPDAIAGVTIGLDGRSFAVSTEAGDVRAWMLLDGKPVSAPVDEGARSSRTTAIAFSPRVDRLFSGDRDGGIRIWDWPESGRPSRIAARRGKLDALAVSPDGHILLTIDNDHRARLMDLREGRSLRTIPGKWLHAAFLGDGTALAMARRDGSLQIVDPTTGTPKPTSFDRPLAGNGAPISWGFQLVAASPDGKKVAAASTKGPLACVWNAGGGPLLKTMRDQKDKISAVAFSGDSRYLLVASVDGTANVWDLEVAADRPRWSLRDTKSERPAIASASMSFGAKKRVATGGRDGRLLLWDLQDDGTARAPMEMGLFEGEIRAIAFTSDGLQLLAGGSDKLTRAWNVGGDRPISEVRRLDHQHTERVNAAVALPTTRTVITASDDTTLRFWAIDSSNLLGTLTSDADSGHWVAFMQDGRFDSSPGGESQVAWIRGDRVFGLDQFAERSRIFGLTKLWLAGEMATVRSSITDAKFPAIAIDPPSDPVRNEVTLTLRLGEDKDKIDGLRLYRNNLPIMDVTDFQSTADPRTVQVRVGLAAGENWLYAMGARHESGALDGRSNVVAVKGPDPATAPRGELHILALGISDYTTSPLQFAHADAKALAEFLERNGFSGGIQPQNTTVLIDRKVTPAAVEEALRKINKRAKPADTVVVFLAGHTDVRANDRYCLLLSDFEFQPGAVLAGLRGPLQAQAKGPRKADKPSTVLPFALIESILARTNVSNRLIVIDACQAEAIFDDPGVRRIREKLVDNSAHKLRNSYLLASRRGEGAKEAVALQHGVLTHLLLRGMGAANLQPEPDGVLGNADLDTDGIITSEEIRSFVDAHLQDLSSRVEKQLLRANPNPNPPQNPVKADPARVGSAANAFPLVRLPG